MEINLKTITRWVESDELDKEFAVFEDDPDWFELQVMNCCDDWDLLKFASNRNSSKREYFANLLAQSLCWIYRVDYELPFHFSRSRGIKDKIEFEKASLNRISMIYEKCRVLEGMRVSEVEEIKILSDKILDFRHDRLKISSEGYYQLIRELVKSVYPRFKVV